MHWGNRSRTTAYHGRSFEVRYRIRSFLTIVGGRSVDNYWSEQRARSMIMFLLLLLLLLVPGFRRFGCHGWFRGLKLAAGECGISRFRWTEELVFDRNR